jgi:hypothetical protein
VIGFAVGGLFLVGLIVAAVVLLLRRRRVTDGRESEVFRDLYVGLDSTFDNPLVTEQEVKFDGVFNGDGDEILL